MTALTVAAAAPAALTVVIYLFLGVTAVRRPLLARIAYRQVVRRPGQSALMVLGMMFASAAILGTATVADSLQASSDDMIVRSWGRVDLTVTNSSRPFPASVADRLALDPRVRSQVAGVSGGLDLIGAVGDIDRDRGLPTAQLVGVDGATIGPFGAFHLTDGRRLNPASMRAGQTVLSTLVAGRLKARVGDRLRVSVGTSAANPRPLEPTVVGIARPEEAGGYGQVPSLFLRLADLQQAAGTELINVVRITVPGEGLADVAAARRAAPAVRDALAAIPEAVGLDLRQVKAADLTDSRSSWAPAKPLMIGVGFLVVLAGVAVVVNLAMVMAEERRPRLAVLRALGLSQADMVQTGLMEAAFYSTGGAALGVLPGLGYAAYELLVKPMTGESWGPLGLQREFAVDPSSIVFAATIGILVSLATSLVATLRTSRMAISSAIKDLPDPASSSRGWWARWAWITALFMTGSAGLVAPILPIRALGGALFLVAAAAALRGRLPERARASLAGAGLAVWGLALMAVTPTDFNTSIAVLILSIVLGVLGLALLVSANLSVLEIAVGAASSRLGATLRPALAYLTRRPIRTGLTTSTLALVLAGIAVFAVMLASLLPDYAAAANGWDVVVRSAGQPLLTLPGSNGDRIAAQTSIRTASYLGPFKTAGSASTSNWHQTYQVFLVLTDEQLQHPPIRLESRDSRFSTDTDVWRALRNDPGLAVTSYFAQGQQLSFGGLRAPVTFRVVAGTGTPILGSSGNWLVVSERALSRLPAHGLGKLILVKAMPGIAPAALAMDIRRQMYGEGVDVSTTRELTDDQRAGATWWITTFLSDVLDVGVLVGVLSLGILALRGVIERRKPIAVLRALGYQPPGVLAALLVEALLLTSIGVGVGLLVGFSAGYALVTVLAKAAAVGLAFKVDMARVVVPVILIYGAVLLASLAPAIRASRLPVAQALRIVD